MHVVIAGYAHSREITSLVILSCLDIRMKTFAEFTKHRLKMIGKTQKDLAERLGVSTAYISQICTDKKNPPDLGKLKNRELLKIWAEFLGAPEEELLNPIRYQLHQVPLRPNAKYEKMRTFLLNRLSPGNGGPREEIQVMQFHPAENSAIKGLIEIYLVLQAEPEEPGQVAGYTPVRFRDACRRAASSRTFIEGELVEFFRERSLWWSWNRDSHDVTFFSDSSEIQEAMHKVRGMRDHRSSGNVEVMIPVVGHVSAGQGFGFTDGGYPAGAGFEQVALPPGLSPALADRLYCVRVRGQSLREFFGDGTLLFIKPESWEEIKDGDLVIFKDSKDGKAFVKKVEFAGDNLVLKPMNPMYNNIVLKRSELMLLERVASVVF